jgi:hypothetical protein
MKGKENFNKMEKNNTQSMDEKVHYEIKFVETEDGYRLEATGNKRALKRLGIGPRMVGRKHPHRKARRSRELRRINRQRRKLAAKARRLEKMEKAWGYAGFGDPGRRGPKYGHSRRFQNRNEFGRHSRKGMPHIEKRNYHETWDW